MDKNAQGSHTYDTCSSCTLLSAQNSICQFCQHDQSLSKDVSVCSYTALFKDPDVHTTALKTEDRPADHTVTNTFIEEPLEQHEISHSQSQPQELSCPALIPRKLSQQDAFRDQSRSHRQDCRVRGDCSLLAHTVMQLRAQLAVLKQEARESGAFNLKQGSQKEGCADRLCDSQLLGREAHTQT